MASRQDVQKCRVWEVRFGRFRASGLTGARFCAQEGVSVPDQIAADRYLASKTASRSKRRGLVLNQFVPPGVS